MKKVLLILAIALSLGATEKCIQPQEPRGMYSDFDVSRYNGQILAFENCKNRNKTDELILEIRKLTEVIKTKPTYRPYQ